MQTKTMYEEKILRELRDLPEVVQEKLSNIMHILTKEFMFFEGDEKRVTDEFLSVCGTWEDNKSAEEQIQTIYSSRRSVSRTEKVF
ncbi:MAG: hypothetical protein EPN22_08235 [Nitrospirae bacterium]|nr:MAG: hypothetical protein EPN22_08235 [Nitrospirota bacterium]